MSLQGGDREFGHGDQVTVEYVDADSASGGEAVYVKGHGTDHPTVEKATDSEDADGVLADGAAQGDYVQVVMHGIVWARVLDESVSAGDFVSESGTAGVLTTTASGDYRVLEPKATDAESGKKIALIRFEN